MYFISVFIIPQRYVLAVMGLLAIANAYTMRVCLNLAITQMVKKTTAVEGDAHYDPNACPDKNLESNITTEAFSLLLKSADVSHRIIFLDSIYLFNVLQKQRDSCCTTVIFHT